MLEAYKRAFSEEIKIFQLQRRVNGVEAAVGGFFNGKKFITPININFEHKKLFPAKSARPPAKWVPRCSGASPTPFSIARC